MPSASPRSARHGKRGNRGSGCADFVTELNELQAGWRNDDVMRQVGSVIGDGVDAFHSDVSDVSKVIQLPLEPGMHLVFAEPARRRFLRFAYIGGAMVRRNNFATLSLRSLT